MSAATLAPAANKPATSALTVPAEHEAPPAAAQLLASVGSTPLLELSFPELPSGTRLFAKLESVNPGGSIKDRPVARMITRALAAGHVGGKSGRRLLDSSSGNAGIAYAQFGAALGVPVTLVVPGNASRERLQRISAYGAELILTDPIEGYDHAVHTARRLGEEKSDVYWYSNQYGNDDNWRAHYEGTAQEILDQVREATGAAPDAFVAGVGTGGTLTGIGRRLKKDLDDIHITSIIPEIFPGIEGLKPLGSPHDLVPDILDEGVIDRRAERQLEEGIEISRRLAQQGIFVGPSSGAYVHAALELAADGDFKTIVTVLNDTGERYASTGMWAMPEGAWTSEERG